MVTIKDIARELGVSPGTVSKGLNNAPDISEALKQKIVDTAISMGYKSSKLKLGSSGKKPPVFNQKGDAEHRLSSYRCSAFRVCVADLYIIGGLYVIF